MVIDGRKAPGLLAFATASSEAAYPRLLEQLERHGVANRVVSFVLPLGALAFSSVQPYPGVYSGLSLAR